MNADELYSAHTHEIVANDFNKLVQIPATIYVNKFYFIRDNATLFLYFIL